MRYALGLSIVILLSSINVVTSEVNTSLESEEESSIISDYSRAIQIAFERVSNLENYDERTLKETTDWVVVTKIPYEVHKSINEALTESNPVSLLKGCYIWSFEDSDKSIENLERLYSNGDIEVFYPLVKKQQSKKFIPNDPQFSEQWHLNNVGQTNGLSGEDINVTGIWDFFNGSGVNISIIDDGLDYNHSDIKPHYSPLHSYDWCNDDSDPMPEWWGDDHGTSVAGVAAAVGNNSIDVVGSAFGATLSGSTLIACSNSDLDEANALSFHNSDLDIYSNSWGPSDNGQTVEAPGPLTLAAFENDVYNGRNGLGNIITWAAGNGLGSDDNANYDGYANSRFTIAVTAISHLGIQSSYAEPGANILVAAHSNGDGEGITTTDITGSWGSTSGNITNSFGGTSSATPLASGVIALMLESNANLTWRDIQHILVVSSRVVDTNDNSWEVNGAGHMVSHKYGFGAVDAGAAVSLAKNWSGVAEETNVTYGPFIPNLSIPDNDNNWTEFDIFVETDLTLESVELMVDIEHSSRGDLDIVLESPSGKESWLAENHADSGDDYNNWIFGSVHHWDESSRGVWKLKIRDTDISDFGILKQYELILHGVMNMSDFDGDGEIDFYDIDDDNDGYNDDVDAFSLDPNEWSDYDMDGYGDNTDMDDDNDGYWDSCEPADWLTAQLVETIEGLNSFNTTSDGLPPSCPLATDIFPLDSNEWIDSDGDGIGNNADEDDDGDGFDDFEELQCDSDSMDDNSIPIDTDSDEVCDFVDNDDDGDGFNDITEIECNTDSLNDKSFPVDFDGDGICDYIDLDDDGDGLSDENETSIHDTNPLDGDSDDDGLNDYEEVIIYETNAKNNDTDGDSLDDNEEVNIHGTNPLMIDSDLDGLTDGDEIQIWNSNPLIYDADNDSDSSYHFEDCNDEDQNIYPGNEELLNNIDDNCDNLVDEGYNDTDSDSDGLVDWSEYHIYGTNILDGDSDGDGISDLVEIDVTNSDPLSFDEDEDEDGFYWFEDCDDFNDNRNPGLLEILDDTDNDCDEDVDEDFTSIDSDSDGLTDYDEYHFYFTNPNIGDTDGDSLPDGYEVNVLNSNPIFTDQDKDADGKFEFEDCDDNDFDVSPGTPEKLDGKDNDCDEEIDEDYKIIDSDGDLILDYDEYHNYSTSALLFDSDQDGLDDGTEILIKNSDPLKFDYDRDKDGFFEFEDCDDRSPSVNPDSNEIWNGIDDDCNQMIDEEINRRLVIFTNPQLETENSSGIVWDLTNDSLIFEISGLPSQLDLDISWNILGFDLDNYVSNNGKRLFLPSIECMNPENDLEIQICDEGEMIQKLTVVIDDSVEEIEIFWSLQIDIWIEPMPSSENLFDSITGISGIVSVVISSLILIIATILVRSKISHKRKLEDALEAYGIIPERLAVSPEARGLDLPSAPEIVKIPDERI